MLSGKSPLLLPQLLSLYPADPGAGGASEPFLSCSNVVGGGQGMLQHAAKQQQLQCWWADSLYLPSPPGCFPPAWEQAEPISTCSQAEVGPEAAL